MSSLQKKYFNSPLKASLRILVWSLREFCKIILERILHGARSWQAAGRPGKEINILVSVDGALGDVLISGLAIQELSKRINYPHRIDVIPSNANIISDLRNIFEGCKFLNVIEISASASKIYDVSMRINRFIAIIACNSRRIGKKSPWLNFFCKLNEAFQKKHFLFLGGPHGAHALLCQWSILNNQKRIQQPDQNKLLEISDKTRTFLNIQPSAFAFLEDLELQKTQYITIQRGVNHYANTRICTRTWPIRHYEKFVKLFHEAFPSIKVVQLGYSRETCNPIGDVDIELLGKTSMAQLIALLKHSIFHLDGDAGMVHMKKFLNGKSIVMFGPTSAELLAYPENINITGNKCQSWCEWLTDDWLKACPRGYAEAPCIASITPEMVMEAAKKIIGDRKEYFYSVIAKNLCEDEIVDYISKQNRDREIKIVDVFNRNGLALAMKLRHNFDDITVFDREFKYDSFAKAREEGLELEYGCLHNISMADDSSDVVIWQNSSRSTPALEYILKELLRILKPKGLLVISGVFFQEMQLKQFNLDIDSFSRNEDATVLTKTLQ
jgi:ADP-heptose:LPS heptosyltransferase